MSVAANALKWLLGGALLLLAVVAAGAYFLLRTQPGQEFILRTAVNQAPRFIDGEVRVGGIRSNGLLSGFTLREVVVADPQGRPFVEADSLRVAYSLAELLRRNVALVPVEVWNADITVETLHGDEQSNVARIFGGAEEDGGGGPGVSVVLRGTRLHDASFTLRMPLEEGADAGRIPTETLSGHSGGRYQVMRFERIQAQIPSASLAGPDQEGQRVRVDELSLVGHVFDEPFTLTDLRGEIVRRDSAVELDLERLWLPESELAGRMEVDWGGNGIELTGDLEAQTFRFADFRWLEPRLPAGGGTFDLAVSGPLDRSRWRVTAADIQSGEDRIRGSFGIDLGEPIQFVQTDLQVSPIHLDLLNEWLDEPLPVEGVVRGNLRADGPLDALRLDGVLTFEDPEREIPPSTAEVGGTLRLAESLGASDLEVTLDPLRFPTLRAFLPDLGLEGEGRARVSASGVLEDGIQITAEVVHRPPGAEGLESAVSISGSIEREGDDVRLQLAGELGELSLDGMAAGLGRELPVGGELGGSVTVSGLLSDLAYSVDLETPGGRLRATGRLDALDPGDSYRIDGEVDQFALHEWLSDLPRPTVLTGEFGVDGAGLSAESLSGTAQISFRESQVLGADLSRLQATLQAAGGRLRIEQLQLRSPVLTATGTGDLALREGEPDGEIELTWAADSLAVLRPVILGDQGIVADTLTQLEREILRLDGVDPDTLAADDGFALEGTAQGELVLRGAVSDLRGEGFVELMDAEIGDGSIQRARADFRGHWAGEGDWRAETVLDFDTLVYAGYEFARGTGGVSYGMGSGDFDLTIQRSQVDRYRLAGDVVRDSTGVSVGLRQLALSLDDAEWVLAGPADVRVEGSEVAIREFRIERPGVARPAAEADGGVTPAAHIEADGYLNLEGESEFDLSMAGVDLARFERIAQTEALPDGLVDLSLRVRGPAESPRMDGELSIREFALGGAALSLIEGTVSYADRALRTQVIGEHDGRRLVRVEGRVPADLSFTEVEDRFPDREIDLTIAADSLPAATALAFLEAVEEVEGTLDGEIRLRGTPEDLRPSGSLRLVGGALSMPGIGLRPEAVTAEFTVGEDFAVEVEAEARAGGTARISGTIALETLTDPGFDLAIQASEFRAVDRRDLTARIGGEVGLGGSYRSPRVTGQVTVTQGELFLEEFTRGAGVVDLSDPAIFDVVDTTLVSVRPVVQAAQNPFLQNLRVDVDLSVDNNFWIRSQGEAQGMDVEIAGDLIVTFDRPAREILLVGNLEAPRGTYTQFGRQFEVQSGTVEFVGTPGIDPSLGIQAVYRLRRRGGDQLDIIANVRGTLQNPQVALSSNSQPPIPESDLVSYLIFGQPSYALGQGETSVVEGAVSQLTTTALNLGVTQLGSAFVRQFGVDYFAVSQAQDQSGIGTFRDLSGRFASTQVETGFYLGEDLFFALILRPLTGITGSTSTRQLPGARLEYSFLDYWTLESYLEDRLARQGGSGFGELDDAFNRVLGISLFREWGY